MNEHGAPRLAGLIALCAVVWVLAYWLTPASRTPAITVDSSSSESRQPAAPVADPAPVREAASGSGVFDPIFVDRGEPDDPVVVEVDPEDVPEPPAGGVEPPEWFIHTVAPGGETLEDIALRYFGKRGAWRAIARMNGGTADPNRIRPGQRLKIPTDIENVQGLPADDDAPPAEPEPAYTEYIVSRNDTLWDIAKALYGNGARWTIIRDANRELVGNEGERLREGMTLRIPPPRGD